MDDVYFVDVVMLQSRTVLYVYNYVIPPFQFYKVAHFNYNRLAIPKIYDRKRPNEKPTLV